MKTSTPRVAAIVAAAVAVTAIATAAVTAAVTGSAETLSPADVDNLLSSGASTSATPAPTASITTSDAAGDTLAHLVPGTVAVRCEGNLATLVSWSPNPGFRSDDPVRGPAAQVSVRFESDTDADYLVTGVCVDGTARVTAGPDTDDHGGGRNGGHGGGS